MSSVSPWRTSSRLGGTACRAAWDWNRLDPHPFVLWLAGVAVLAPIGWLLGTYVPDLDSWTDPPSSGWENVRWALPWVSPSSVIQFERADNHPRRAAVVGLRYRPARGRLPRLRVLPRPDARRGVLVLASARRDAGSVLPLRAGSEQLLAGPSPTRRRVCVPHPSAVAGPDSPTIHAFVVAARHHVALAATSLWFGNVAECFAAYLHGTRAPSRVLRAQV